MTTFLTIQQAAAATGLTVHTLRYYERIGLIDPIPRQGNRHRQYREEDLRWIGFLTRLRSTGLPIRQMLRYAELRRQGNANESVSERKAILQRHTLTLETALSDLTATLDIMRSKIASYDDMVRRPGGGPETHPRDKEATDEPAHKHESGHKSEPGPGDEPGRRAVHPPAAASRRAAGRST